MHRVPEVGKSAHDGMPFSASRLTVPTPWETENELQVSPLLIVYVVPSQTPGVGVDVVPDEPPVVLVLIFSSLSSYQTDQ